MSSGILGTKARRLATWERPRRFLALEQFANLGLGLEDLRRFRRKWPDFFPQSLYRDSEEAIDTRVLFEREGIDCRGRTPELHDLQTYLRQIWSGQDRDGLILGGFLGVTGEDSISPDVSALVTGHFEPATGFLNWRTGSFQYQPRGDFRKALYLLWQESWRARQCLRCAKYFIASTPAQFYCSTACGNAVKRSRGKEWWRHHGNKWREERKGAGKPRRKRGK